MRATWSNVMCERRHGVDDKIVRVNEFPTSTALCSIHTSKTKEPNPQLFSFPSLFAFTNLGSPPSFSSSTFLF